MTKICKYCGEQNQEKLVSFKRKNDSVRCVLCVCKKCTSERAREANLGKPCREETKQILREINLGKKQSQETIDKRREKLMIPCSEEKKEKIRKAVTGFKHTPEARKKMSKLATGRKQSPETIAKRVAKIKGIKHPPRPKGFSEKMSKTMKKAMDNPITKEKNRQHFYNCLKNSKLGKPTSIELAIMKILDKHNIEYERQRFMKEIKHAYAADFFIPEVNLVIEADGVFWHNYPNGNEIDHVRTYELEHAGFNVLRFWGNDIRENVNMVEQTILGEL
jgi:very-short-patch-repair endonuclease